MHTIIGIPPHIIIMGIPIPIMDVMASQRSCIFAIIAGSTGVIFMTIPSFVISQDILQAIGTMPMPFIIGIMAFIMGMPPIMPFIIGIMPFIMPFIIGMPLIIGIMPFIIGIMPFIIMGIMPIMPFIIGMPFEAPIIGVCIGFCIIGFCIIELIAFMGHDASPALASLPISQR